MSALVNAYDGLARLLDACRSPILLIMRLYWGYGFFMAGKGKLLHLERAVGFFADLGIPVPYFSALLAGTAECLGGLLILIGLGSRLAAIPLVITMIVAYLTAFPETLFVIQEGQWTFTLIEKPEAFLGADPFMFLLTAAIVMAFGPGYFALDTILKRKLK